jgi:hypothetical protein
MAHFIRLVIGDWMSTWHSKLLNGTHWTEQGFHMMTIDGSPALCIEHELHQEKALNQVS